MARKAPTDIHITDFVRRQTPESCHSHWNLWDETLIARVREGWFIGAQGYREGVMLVPVNPEGFFTSIVTLKKGDKLAGAFVPRVPGEEPRKTVVVESAHEKQPAVMVDVVLYRDDVLAEGGDQTGHEWNIVSVNAYPTDEPAPMHPDTLIANHFKLSGGTATNMTPEEFEAALRRAVMYWKDKAMVGGVG